MSYDVDVGQSCFNYTSNVSKLFYDHIPNAGKGGGIRELADITGADAVVVIADAMKRMMITLRDIGDQEFSRRYDSQNNWGSAIGGILFLGNILAASVDNPQEIVTVSL